MTDRLQSHEEEVLRLVESEVEPALQRGCLRLEVSPAVTDGEPLYWRGATIDLVPTNPEAAPINIMIGPDDLTLGFGKLLRVELYPYRGNRAEMLDDLLAWVRAVMAGGFDETVWVVRDDEAFKAKGVIVVDGVPVTVFWRCGFGFFRRKAYMRRTYAPYCPPE